MVYKADARGIVNAEESTTVAVKTVKKTADNMYIKALASELKIMVHLGKHINIVNLLGACTKNAGKSKIFHGLYILTGLIISKECTFVNYLYGSINYLLRFAYEVTTNTSYHYSPAFLLILQLGVF